MKPVLSLALMVVLIVALAGCTLPGAPLPTPTMPPFPPVVSKAPPVNTLAPLPTFTSAVTLPVILTATTAPTQPIPKSGTQPAATQPAQPTPTQVAPIVQATATKAPTVQPTATKAAPTVPPATSKDIKTFMIALNDNGVSGKKIGCGDSVLGVVIQVPDLAAPLRGALDKLLAAHTQFYGQSGLYNALFRSDLKVDMVTVANGIAEIKLSGVLTMGGVCDAPRVQAQIEETALQFTTVQKVDILVNGVRLQDLLSLK